MPRHRAPIHPPAEAPATTDPGHRHQQSLATPVVRRRSSDRKAWLGVGCFALVWLAAYAANRPVWEWAVTDLAGVERASRLGEVLLFFLIDTIKIGLLLTGVIFAVSVIRSFLSVERTRQLLQGRHQIVGYAMAAALGVATPFCSCSAVPVFIGFVAAGVPLGITMTFLIASPLVNEVAVVLIGGTFGWGVATLYVTTGLAIAVTAGVVIGRLAPERWVEPFVYETRVGTTLGGRRQSWSNRFRFARDEVRTILRRIWPYLLVGIAIGAVIHGWAPEDFFARYAGADNPAAVPIAVLAGIPLYSSAAGTIPLVEALYAKGVALGTALAFMMSVVALSLPELVLLRRVLRPQLLATFVGVVGAGILAVGFLFNIVL